MKPGPTPSPFSRNSGEISLTEAGSDLWKTILFLWTVAGILSGGAVLQGLGAADLISSSVSADGSVMSFSAYQSGNADITSRLFGLGRTVINRETETRGLPASRLQAQSDGPLLFGEYSDITGRREDKNLVCVFANQTLDDTVSRTQTESAGILQHGSLLRDISINPAFSSITMNGSGLVSLSHRLDGNESLTGRSVASGNLTITEIIRRDQG